MSSLAAARADNFYHPPDWDPRKESRAEYHAGPGWKAHPLRERAKKIDEGILVIRFEMPFDVRCSGCGNRIAKGVRFDAEKKCVGKYLSSKIWSFRMMCAAEDNTSRTSRDSNPHFIEIRTDPKLADYVVAEGAVKVVQTERTAEELGVEKILDPEEIRKREADPFYKLEHQRPAERQQAEARARGPRMTQLQDLTDQLWSDDYASSQMLRRAHRAERKAAFSERAVEQAKGIRVPLLAELPTDRELAAGIDFGGKRRRSDAARGEKRLRLLSGSIFSEGVREPQLHALQQRRERGMQISLAPRAGLSRTRTAGCYALAVAPAPSRPSAEPSAGRGLTDDQEPECGPETTGRGSATPAVLAEEETAEPGGLVAYSDSDST